MAFINPVYGIIVPFLFFFTIPFAIFASLTAIFAFSILFFRVLIVYIELALAVIPYWILGQRTSIISSPPNLSPPLPRAKSFSNFNSSAGRRRKRRGSTSSNLSATGSITPISGENSMRLSQSIGPTRDYEGVGGWRVDNPSDDEGLWTKINSNLELPADHVRRHRRSLTSGSLPHGSRIDRSCSPEAVMNTSRARTPPSVLAEGYFPPQGPGSPKASKRTPSANTGISGSSTSSKGSGGLSMKQR